MTDRKVADEPLATLWKQRWSEDIRWPAVLLLPAIVFGAILILGVILKGADKFWIELSQSHPTLCDEWHLCATPPTKQ